MGKSWLLCVLLGALAWGQAAPTAPAPAPGQVPPANQSSADTSASVPPDAPVLTINGVCAPQPKTAGTAAKSATDAKTAAKSPAECKTVVTKAQFEKVAKALSPDGNISPQLKRQLGGGLPGLIAVSEAAKKKGIDKTPEFAELVKLQRMEILARKLQLQLQKDAANIPPADLEKYYKDHANDFEQFNMDRIFVPRTKQVEPEAAGTSDEKLTEEQQKNKQDAEKAKAAQAELDMTKVAEDLQKRAAAGEDFTKLQKEAYAAAGMKIESTNVNLASIRRTGVPPGHVSVFDLKPGEVSQVISDAGGHYVYKLNSKTEEPFDQAQNEIRSRLQNDRMREAMEKLNNSYKVDTNEAYFGPGGTNPMPRPGPGGMSRQVPTPRPAPPNAPSAQPRTPPQTQAPEQKPN